MPRCGTSLMRATRNIRTASFSSNQHDTQPDRKAQQQQSEPADRIAALDPAKIEEFRKGKLQSSSASERLSAAVVAAFRAAAAEVDDDPESGILPRSRLVDLLKYARVSGRSILIANHALSALFASCVLQASWAAPDRSSIARAC